MVKKLFLLFLMVFALSFAFACNETKDDDKQNEETKEFTVTFTIDGEKTEVKVKDGEKAVKPQDPEKEGYVFKGWYVGEEEYDFEKAVNADLEVTAKFEEKAADEPGDEPGDEPEVKEYTVKFVVDGEVTETKVKEGEKVAKPADPVKDGYNFLGWFAGEEAYDFGAVTADVTVTAKFEEVIAEYTVKFVVDGEASEVKVVEGEKVAKPADPVKDGYVFLGWFAGEEAYDFETLVTSDLEVVAKFEEEIKEIVPVAIEFVDTPATLFMDDVVTLQVKVLPEGAPQEVVWKCINKTKASIDENGVISPLRSGDTKFQAICATDTSIKAEITINIKSYINPDKFINSLHVENPIAQIINVTGYQFVYKHVLLGGVTNYLFEDLNIIDYIIPEGTSNRPGTIMTPKYVTVHDTASSAESAGALTHAKYWTNGGGGTSIHFTTGNDGVYRVLPYNEVAYHAGDGTSTPLKFTDTGVKAIGDEPATVTLSPDGYFEMNGEKTSIKAPTKDDGTICKNSDLPYTGINNYVDPKTGTYWISNTWWSNTYKTLSNRGGNLNSVGIETCVNKGTNMWYTWAITAKLVGADILPKNALLPRDVKQHNTFSGKNCPQTMREANRWETFMECVVNEYYMTKYFKSWDIEFSCDSPYIASNGTVKNLPDVETEVTYTIKFSNGSDYDKTFTFTSKLAKASDYVI